MAEKLFLADKKTLDEVKQDTSNIITNLNNKNKIILDPLKFDVIISKEQLKLDTTRTLLSINSNKRGGFFKYLSLKADRGQSDVSKNMIIKIIIDDKTYIQTWEGIVNHFQFVLNVCQNNINTQYDIDKNGFNNTNFDKKYIFKNLSQNNLFPNLSDSLNKKYKYNYNENVSNYVSIENPSNSFVFFKDKFEIIVSGEKEGAYSGAISSYFFGGVRI